MTAGLRTLLLVAVMLAVYAVVLLRGDLGSLW